MIVTEEGRSLSPITSEDEVQKPADQELVVAPPIVAVAAPIAVIKPLAPPTNLAGDPDISSLQIILEQANSGVLASQDVMKLNSLSWLRQI